MVTTWPKDFPALGTGANNLAHSIEALSDGRLHVKVYGAGELVPASGVFDAVSGGTAEMGHGAAYYWKGKHEATQFFSAVPFGLNAAEINGWLRYGGGQSLWDELYADFNLRAFPGGNTGVQMGGWFNREINTLSDFSGLVMRMPGLGGEVLRRLEVTVKALPAAKFSKPSRPVPSTPPNGLARTTTSPLGCTKPPNTTTGRAGTSRGPR